MNSSEISILTEFNQLKPHLTNWGNFVDDTLTNKILKKFRDEHLVKIFPKHRIKDDKSYIFKALYRKKGYKNPLIDIEDKIGTRIILLKSADIKLVEELILQSNDWIAKITKNINQEIEDKPTIFDYQSSHIVIKPRKDNPHFEDNIIDFLSCEIQIRTLLQHAFAEVSHDSTYKGPYKNDKDILRKLSKSMALMEATDDYFCEIFTMMTDEKRHYRNYLNELINLYKKFNPNFVINDLNLELTDNIFELLDLINVPISDLEGFLIKNENDISGYIKSKNGELFLQPVILLILYYFFKERNFLRNNWVLNEASLKKIYSITNTSFENY